MSPDESVRCRCGRATYLVPGYDSARTCARCGYLVSYCRCGLEGEGKGKTGLNLPSVSG